MNERGLAGAVRADERVELAALDDEGYTPSVATDAAEALAQIAHFQQRLSHGAPPRCRA